MNKFFTKIAALSVGLAMAIGVGVAVGSKEKEVVSVRADNFSTTYAYSDEGTSWSQTNFDDAGDYWRSSADADCIASISGLFTNKTITSDVTITLDVACYGNGSSPTSSKFSIHSNTSCTSEVSSTQTGTLPTDKNYKSTVYTVSKNDATSNFSSDLGIKIASGTKLIRFRSFTVAFSYTASSSGTLDHISLSGTYPTAFTVGDSFSHEGMTVTAHYTNPTSTSNVTSSASWSGYNMSSAGNQTVTVTYSGKTATYGITVSAPVAVSSVELDLESKTLEPGGSVTLTATVLPNNAANKNVTWESSNELVASVADGVVTARSSGTATITVKSAADATKTDTCAITVNGGDITLNYSNSPFTKTSGVNEQDTNIVGGITYKSLYGYKYSTNSTLEFYKSNNTGYLGNSTAYDHYINKIVICWYAYNNSSYLTVTQGNSELPTSGTITATNSGMITTYNFTANTNRYFKIARNTNNNYYLEFISIEIYFGDEVRELSSISVKTSPRTAYLSGENFDPTGLVLTLTYSAGSPLTEDVAYSSENKDSFSFDVTTVTAACEVTITYSGKTCKLSLSLTTVSTVDSVASHPETIYVDGGIEGSEVKLNVTLASNDHIVVDANHVVVDDSEVADDVVATAWYTVAETDATKKATFTVDVIKAPVYIYPVDDIVSSDLAATSTTYAAFSGVSKTSSAVYAGQTSLPSAGMIGIRSAKDSSDNYSGIVSTTSGGLIYQVSITDFDHDTRKIDIYGSNTAYTGANDLYGESKGTKLGEITKESPSLLISGEYQYVGLTGQNGLVKSSKISFTWKVEGTDNPMTANPVLTLGKNTIGVGSSTALTVSTTPDSSDEILIVTSSDSAVATVAGSGKSYTVSGVSAGSATITVLGKQSGYQSSVEITVEEAVQNELDKVLTTTTLGLSGSTYSTNDGDHDYDGDVYTTSNVAVTNGIQFKKQGDGKLYNKLAMKANIKRITLVMNSNNSSPAAVYKGDSANPSTTSVEPLKTYSNTGVNTYEINAAFFTIKTTSTGNALNVEKIIIELDDTNYSDLALARSAASAILTSLGGLCGDGGSGVVTQSQWDSLSSQLTALSLTSEAKNILKEASRISLDDLSQGGALIENAMAHYDACVTKFGFTPFNGVTDAKPSGSNFVSPLSVESASNATIIIVVISLVSLTAVGGYFLLKKKKEQ